MLRVGPVALRWSTRGAAVNAALLLIALAGAVFALGFGDYPLEPAQVLAALANPSADEFHRTIVTQWRLPVALAAVLFGALLGIGGAIFQSLTHNPLGSPDVIGFDAGSYTAVVITVLVFGTKDYWTIAAAALVGGLATAAIVYFLAYRGGVQGFRLIIVGIAVSAMLGSINVYLVTRADINDAMSVGFWAAGSLGRVTWQALVPAALCSLAVMVGVLALSRALRQLELGDATAVTQGTPAHRCRPALLILGVATTALVTAAAGPIGFVALAAPQLARRLTHSPGVTVTAAACMGAALLAGAHLLALLFAQIYRPIPEGLITVSLGGLYLIWLLIRESRKSL
ncbi:iron chelate uptake ABC transporter family permease subunit [Corynebacterium lizhenjunii]|uniref:Iron chelate uptake ABC transporter family permease subunit n=2 Tax=Corynebacterium lizhenjunii TaxID=2709394 RepID=A0A7T0KHG2_9CORY|nr:iron chelate uptake ABC transporter family permease subunit [Corynebacterium lizhenjunii]